ncbi:MAG: FAD-dependent oxidoreductase [Kiritimatiellales bacterium]|nr:FAD-dependent oxidoreductase [Kiritimatiellales bacterium]MCF7864489.1 FAD-dependent oxidoreductase [Kiritimatiellales bacterium]
MKDLLGLSGGKQTLISPTASLSVRTGKAAGAKDFQWLEKNIPCQKACPASTDIPAYLTAVHEGDHDAAYRINLRDNIFPAVLGRVCSRPCEAACRHGWEGLGEPVSICFSKRSAADFKNQDLVLMEPWFGSSGKTIAIVGAGPAGLTAARNLALLGHRVTVYEKHDKPGGMMNQGIPAFRLPRETIEKEIAQIAALGVDIVCNTEIGKTIQLAELTTNNDAVIMAAGTLLPNMLNLPGKELDGIRHGLDFLLEVNQTGSAKVGERVIVIGGGFTAMDCARTARRLGATTVQLDEEWHQKALPGSILRIPKDLVNVWYRRSVDEMPITPGELDELENEHIPLECMVSPKAYIGKNGHVAAMQFIRTELGEPDASGRRQPIEITGSEFEIEVDTVLLATSQFPDTSWIDESLAPALTKENGWLKGDGKHATEHKKIFAAGDFAEGANSLIQAIAHAKACARKVDTFLMGEERLKDVVVIEDVKKTGRKREMDWVGQQKMPTTPLTHRDLPTEVELGYDEQLSVTEAQRCYRCHYKFEIDQDKCILCDVCIKARARPECILQLKELRHDDEGRVVSWEVADTPHDIKMIWINEEECIRCNACLEVCPAYAITIQKVSLATEPACP